MVYVELKINHSAQVHGKYVLQIVFQTKRRTGKRNKILQALHTQTFVVSWSIIIGFVRFVDNI